MNMSSYSSRDWRRPSVTSSSGLRSAVTSSSRSSYTGSSRDIYTSPYTTSRWSLSLVWSQQPLQYSYFRLSTSSSSSSPFSTLAKPSFQPPSSSLSSLSSSSNGSTAPVTHTPIPIHSNGTNGFHNSNNNDRWPSQWILIWSVWERRWSS